MRASRIGVALVSIVMTAAVMVAIGTFGCSPTNVNLASAPAMAGENAKAAAPALAGLPSLADVTARALPGVVNIASTRRIKGDGGNGLFQDPFFRHFFGFGQQPPPDQVQRGLGSGVLVSIDGKTVIVTNNHVVEHADEIQVTLSDKREISAKVLGTDPQSDLAVIAPKTTKDLKTLPIGDSNAMRLGDIVLAVGNPFGLDHSVTMGIISAKGRANLNLGDNSGAMYQDFLQTDAAINPGNSGGALVNTRGELIGINTAILSRSGGYQGIGFAIPTAMMVPVVRSLITSGKVVRGYLGVMIQDVNTDLAKALKLPGQHGALVADVVGGSPADKAGIKREDFIRKVDGRAVESANNLRNTIASFGAKKQVKLELWRDGKTKSVTVTLAAQPKDGVATAAGKGVPGVRLSGITPMLRQQLNIPANIRQGVVVEAVDPASKAGASGLQAGDVILKADRAKIDSVSRFTQAYTAARGRVVLLVYRQGATFFLLLQK